MSGTVDPADTLPLYEALDTRSLCPSMEKLP